MIISRHMIIELVQRHHSAGELEVYNATRHMLMSSSPGARMHLEDMYAPTCPLCDELVRVADHGRYIYYRRQGVRALPITRFAHERCVRHLCCTRPATGKGMGPAWVPHGGELRSVI